MFTDNKGNITCKCIKRMLQENISDKKGAKIFDNILKHKTDSKDLMDMMRIDLSYIFSAYMPSLYD